MNNISKPILYETSKSWLTLPLSVLGATAVVAALLVAHGTADAEAPSSATNAEYGLQSARVTANKIAAAGVITLTGTPFTYDNGSFTSRPTITMDATLSDCRKGSNPTLSPIYVDVTEQIVLGYGEMAEGQTVAQANAINFDGTDYVCQKIHMNTFAEN